MKVKSLITGTVLVTIISLTTWALASNKKEIDSKKEVKISNSLIAVTVEPTQMREINNQLRLTGTADPCREVAIASDAAGKIVSLNFKIGDYVTQGTVLAKVDDTYKRLSYESALLNYNKYKEDKERYKILRQGEAVSDNQLREIEIAFENASIQLENAKKQLNDTKIVAPFSGYITSKNTEIGAFVGIGTPIAGIADISQLKVVLSVSESDIYNLSSGQEVTVNTEIYPDVDFKAKIANVGSRGSRSHTYPVEILITNNSKNQIKAGTYVNVNVEIGTSAQKLMIPRDAIISSIKAPSVYVTDGTTVKLTKIGTGKDYDSYLEVISGLNEGDMVITTGQINLTDGSKVVVINQN